MINNISAIPISPRILIGSHYFFEQYSNFSSKDLDFIQLVSENETFFKRHFIGNQVCLFQIKKLNTADDYIQRALLEGEPMVVGKFLVPEFNELIGFTVEMLPKLKSLIDQLDKKHEYEEIIYSAYLENGSFILTQEQRDEAYKSYRLSRGLEV